MPANASPTKTAAEQATPPFRCMKCKENTETADV